jgi:iron complex transport system ATP-binding protein
MATLKSQGLDLSYEKRIVIQDMNLEIPHGAITALVGPNGCGKSTLLRGLARLLTPHGGSIYLDGKAISSIPSKQLARQMGLLPQSPTAPEGLLVEDLVARGRYPHQSWLAQWSRKDEAAVDRALALTRTTELRGRTLDELSGGQRQRVWIAMALAQQTTTLLLDEPTTFLDIAYQIEILELLQDLHENEGRTIVVVLHDLNQACRFATHLVALRGGRVIAEGPPSAVVDESLVRAVFDLPCRMIDDPITGAPLFVPVGNRTRTTQLTPSSGGRSTGPALSTEKRPT